MNEHQLFLPMLSSVTLSVVAMVIESELIVVLVVARLEVRATKVVVEAKS